MASIGFTMALVVLLMVDGIKAGAAEEKATQEVMRRLQNPDLYDKNMRPPGIGATDVRTQVYLRDIDIDDVNMQMSVDMTFRMIWNDSRLAYSNLPEIARVPYVSLMDPSPIWLPDAFFKNAKTVQYKSIHPEQYIRIYSNGNLVYSTRIALRLSCPMDLSRFPHDTQVCQIKIASYGYTMRDIRLLFTEDKTAVTFTSDIHGERFTLESFNTSVTKSVTSTGEYSSVEVSMKIRRHFTSYLIEWYIPVMFLVVVAWFSFLIPRTQFVGRLLLTLISLITLTFLSSKYKDSIASVHYVTAVDTFCGTSLTIVFLTLVYVIVCEVYENKDASEKRGGSGSEEDTEAGKAGSEGWMKRIVNKAKQRGDYLTKTVLISIYVFFLFVYFVAYCGTG